MDDKALERTRRRVRLRDLETLVAVTQAGGMRKAAMELHLRSQRCPRRCASWKTRWA